MKGFQKKKKDPTKWPPKSEATRVMENKLKGWMIFVLTGFTMIHIRNSTELFAKNVDYKSSKIISHKNTLHGSLFHQTQPEQRFK